MGENDNNGVDILNDEQADLTLEIPSVELKEGEETVQVPAATIKQLTQTAKTALAQKKHWRGKAIDPESGKPYKDLAAARKDINAPDNSKGTTPEVEKRLANVEQAEEKRQFGHANKLSPEETDHAFSLAQGMGKKPSEVLDLPFFKAGVESMRREARNAGATPGPSGRAPIVEGKNWKDMDEKDRSKNFGAVVAGITGRK